MRRVGRLIKRLSALFLVLIFCIETFGAVVGDNDGAAFITKAEFDSKTNDFQAAINEYESRIDQKIESVISAYLAGIKAETTEPYSLIPAIRGVLGQDLRFLNTIAAGTTLTTRYSITKEKAYSFLWKDQNSITVTEINADNYKNYFGNDPTKDNTCYTQINLNSGSSILVNYATESGYVFKTVRMYRYWYMGTPKSKCTLEVGDRRRCGTVTYGSDYYSQDPTTPVGIEKGTLFEWSTYGSFQQSVNLRYSSVQDSDDLFDRRPYCAFPPDVPILVCASLSGSYARPSDIKNTGIIYSLEENKEHENFSGAWSQNGAGECWTYLKLKNGNNFLLGYSQCYPVGIITYTSKRYKNLGAISAVAQAFADTTATNNTVEFPAIWGYKSSGTRYNTYSTSTGFWSETISSLYRGTMDTKIQMSQVGKNTNSSIKAVDINAGPLSSGNLNSNATYGQHTATIHDTSNTISAANITCTGITVTQKTDYTNKYEQMYLSGVAGETVFLGNGAPLLRTRSGDTHFRVKLTFLSRNASGTAAQSPITCKISKNKFTDGNYTATSDRLYENTSVLTNLSGIGEVTFELDNLGKDSLVWFNLFSNTDGYTAECTNCEITKLN